jgi:hypothetical protein
MASSPVCSAAVASPSNDDELVEDRPRLPLDDAPGVDREEGLDAEGYPAANQSVEEAVRREALWVEGASVIASSPETAASVTRL